MGWDDPTRYKVYTTDKVAKNKQIEKNLHFLHGEKEMDRANGESETRTGNKRRYSVEKATRR
jgi:hypothetical protein